jgi:dipeptidyl aminopeptidase/acylaminoacyl peptidase
MNADGTGQTGLSLGTSGATGRPSWSPDGSRIAFARGRVIEVINADGSGQMPLTPNTNGFDNDPAWSPDSQFIAYHNGIDFQNHLTVMNADGTNHTMITNNLDRRPDWQPTSPSYARPKGATPMQVSLVPAYVVCASPNREHGPPLAFSSCSPPAQSSSHLTVGSPDANGQPAKSTGFVRAVVIAGNPATQTDEADVTLQLQVTDVRNIGDLEDYTGEVQVRTNLRLTDKLNTPAFSAPGTVIDMPFTFTAGCAATADATVGGTCQVTTSADAIAFGTVPESRRSIWQLGRIEVFDGGPDGVASTSGNTLFETGGVFIP